MGDRRRKCRGFGMLIDGECAEVRMVANKTTTRPESECRLPLWGTGLSLARVIRTRLTCSVSRLGDVSQQTAFPRLTTAAMGFRGSGRRSQATSPISKAQTATNSMC